MCRWINWRHRPAENSNTNYLSGLWLAYRGNRHPPSTVPQPQTAERLPGYLRRPSVSRENRFGKFDAGMPAPGEGPIGYHLDRVQEELYVERGAGINWRAGLCAPGRKPISAVSAGNHRQNSEVSVRARQTWERGGMKVLRWIWLSCSAAYFWKRLMSSANSSSSTRRQRCATHRLCPYLAPMEKEEMGGLCQSPFGGRNRAGVPGPTKGKRRGRARKVCRATGGAVQST